MTKMTTRTTSATSRMKPSKKFWNKNEKAVMERLGLKCTPASGAGVVFKEDGRSEHIVCQLKSTVSDSVKVNRLDVDNLKYNADMERKIPVFVIQFLGGQTLVATTIENIQDVGLYLRDGKRQKSEDINIAETSIKREQRNKIKANTSFKPVARYIQQNKIEKPETITEVNQRRRTK